MTQKQSMEVLTSSFTNEWYTPPEYADAAREVMGSIDLDPASSEIANRLIRAKKYFTKEDDGLSKTWFGNIFVNPPYGKIGTKSKQDVWSHKLMEEFLYRRTQSAIILTRVVAGYVWFDNLFHKVRPPVCITEGRIAFIKPEWVNGDGSVTRPKKGAGRSKVASAFWYFGMDWGKFEKVFKQFGRVILP